MDAPEPRGTPAPLPPRLRLRIARRLGLRRAPTCAPLLGGRSALSYLLASGGETFVVKLTRPGDGGGPLFPVCPDAEAAVMAHLAPTGLAAPPLGAFTQGRAFVLVYRRVPGASCRAPNPALARLLRRLHDTPLTGLGHLHARHGPRRALVARAVAFLRAERDIAALRALRDATRHAPARLALVHGDPVPGNVLAARGGPRLIDWQCARLGDPADDLALALAPAMQVVHGLPPLSGAQRAAFLRAYDAPDVAARLQGTRAARHAEMIGHCLWRLDRGDRAYAPALDAERAALHAHAAALEDERLQQPGEPDGQPGASPDP